MWLGGGEAEGCSWLHCNLGGLSLGKCRDAQRFWLGGEEAGLSSLLCLALGTRGQQLLLPQGEFTFTASPTKGEPLLLRVAFEVGSLLNTQLNWKGPSSFTQVPQGKTQDPNPLLHPSKELSPGCLWKPSCCCPAPLFSATASGSSLHLNRTIFAHQDTP